MNSFVKTRIAIEKFIARPLRKTMKLAKTNSYQIILTALAFLYLAVSLMALVAVANALPVPSFYQILVMLTGILVALLKLHSVMEGIDHWMDAGYSIIGVRGWVRERRALAVAAQQTQTAVDHRIASGKQLRAQYIEIGERLAEHNGQNAFQASLNAHAALESLLNSPEGGKV